MHWVLLTASSWKDPSAPSSSSGNCTGSWLQRVRGETRVPLRLPQVNALGPAHSEFVERPESPFVFLRKLHWVLVTKSSWRDPSAPSSSSGKIHWVLLTTSSWRDPRTPSSSSGKYTRFCLQRVRGETRVPLVFLR